MRNMDPILSVFSQNNECLKAMRGALLLGQHNIVAFLDEGKQQDVSCIIKKVKCITGYHKSDCVVEGLGNSIFW